MYLGYQNGKIKFYTEEKLDKDLYNLDDEMVYTDDEYVLSDDLSCYVKKDAQWEEQQTIKRRENFENEFLSTSLGNYRLNPRGYANAQQSIDTVNANVQYAQGLTAEIAELVIFYPTPDFTKPEECTEEWLVAHQYNPEPKTLQQWAMYYIEFARAYATKKYQQELRNKNVL